MATLCFTDRVCLRMNARSPQILDVSIHNMANGDIHDICKHVADYLERTGSPNFQILVNYGDIQAQYGCRVQVKMSSQADVVRFARQAAFPSLGSPSKSISWADMVDEEEDELHVST